MPVSQRQADAYIREMTAADKEAREKHKIEYKDVTLAIRVDVLTQATFHNHEDED